MELVNRIWGYILCNPEKEKWLYSSELNGEQTEYENIGKLLDNECPSWYDADMIADEFRRIMIVLEKRRMKR